MVGRLSFEKDPASVIKAFYGRKSKKEKVLVLGDGPLKDELLKMQCENVVFVGFTNRVNEYLKAADYYISNSYSEGLSNTILESMSVGLPMLLSDIASHNEILANFTGKQCVSVKIDEHCACDVDKAIDKALLIQRDDISNLIQNVYEDKYTARIMSAKYQNLYLSLVK